MIIDIESDENDLFLNAKLLTQDDKFLVERYLAQYLALNIDSKFEFYLFLCDEVWNTVSKMIIYKGLWKQKQNKCNFGKYNSSKEYCFYNNDKSKVMFASLFKIDKDDIDQAIKINSNQISKHSFIFLIKELVDFNVEDIFKALNIFKNKYGGNDWDKLKDFSKKHKIIPIQRWDDGNVTSLRFFLYDNIKIFKENPINIHR